MSMFWTAAFSQNSGFDQPDSDVQKDETTSSCGGPEFLFGFGPVWSCLLSDLSGPTWFRSRSAPFGFGPAPE